MKKLNRRDFLERAAVLGASLSAGALLVACKGGGGSSELSCIDTAGMSEADISTRTSMAYVDVSTVAGKNCSTCALYTQPSTEGECGGCTVVRGPINPAGYCNVWAEAQG